MIHSGKLRNMASVYLLRDGKILLLYRQGESIVRNLWIGSAGGKFENTELNDAKACVLRELTEELGIHENQLDNLSLRYITLRNADGEVRQNYYFFANLKDSVPDILPSTEGVTQWFAPDEIVDLPMPFTAKYVLSHYFSTGKSDDCLYGGLANDNGVSFLPL